jgi:hypothetical protein
MADVNGLGSGFFGIDDGVLSGADMPVPLADNSGGAPAMQPSTPTGNGSGTFFDVTAGQLLSTGLNYALQKDKLSMQDARIPTVVQASAIQTQQSQQRNSSVLLIGALIVGALVLMHQAE